MSLLYAVDPGTIQSALVIVDDSPRLRVVDHVTDLNPRIQQRLRAPSLGSTLVIEQIEAMGMAVGAETFETVFWTGRFFETWPAGWERHRLPRRPIKLHLCGSMQAKDAHIRQALLDRFGGSQAIGRKHSQGPLYGVKGHEFAALAVAVTWLETHGAPTTHAPLGATHEHSVRGSTL